MPDKDFDNLFRDKFMDAEIEPSANLWAKIEDQLEPKQKRILPIYWMAAASVAIAFTAMLVFQKSDKIQLRPDEVTAATTSPMVEQSEEPTLEEAATGPAQSRQVAQLYVASAKANASQAKLVESAVSENVQLAVQPNTSADRLPIKQSDPRPIDVLPITPAENPIVIAQVATQQQADNNSINEFEDATERKGIRNVGDLVNYVVDRVDKRDKKLLRFNTDDDDNSSLVGINIGFLKLNKKNKDR
ncbi:MAG: hypothetical protein ACQUHE_03570 [Bacteroidia bacterium]